MRADRTLRARVRRSLRLRDPCHEGAAGYARCRPGPGPRTKEEKF